MKNEFRIRFATQGDLNQIQCADYLNDADKLVEKLARNEIIVCDDGGQVTGIPRYMWFWDYIPFSLPDHPRWPDISCFAIT